MLYNLELDVLKAEIQLSSPAMRFYEFRSYSSVIFADDDSGNYAVKVSTYDKVII